MISKVLEHSTRKISFLADELKPWTEADEQLINAYLKLHDKEQHLQDTGKVLQNETNLLNKEIEQTRQNLADVEKEIKEVSKFADTFILPDPKKEDKATRIFEEADKVYKTIINHQQLLVKLGKIVEKFDVLKSGYLDSLEDFTLWDEFSDVSHEHSKNYETNSIDIVSFDSEDQFFRAYVSVHEKSNEGVYDRADKSIENYNMLISETKVQYATWEEFLKRLQLIRAIIENSGSVLINSAN